MTNKPWITQKLKFTILNRDNFTCKKCGFKGRTEDLEVHHIKMRVDEGQDNLDNLVTLCAICHHYSPDEQKDFETYLNEKIDWMILDTFRKSARSISRRTKKGMFEKSKSGNPITRAPWGYKIESKKLIPTENSFQVQEVFQDFLNQTISLTKLAKKYGFSVNGLKKILTNQAYLGKTKFDGQTHQGVHQPLISSTLFNHVQNKLEKLGIKQNS
jgi:DNA invertase Pin-like site-specific DNA recombinase